MNIVVLMMYFANKSGVNVGVIMTITSLASFLTAVFDYFLYKIKLEFKDILGMIIIVTGSICICLTPK
jgi:drug/metabolite transporter (DMT)-like permease